MSEAYAAPASGVTVLHTLTTHNDTPATARELAEGLNASRSDVSDTLLRLDRAGYVTREKRTEGGFGPNPYEYSVYQPSESDEI